MLQEETKVTEMMEKALMFCAEKTGLTDGDQVVQARALGDCATCEYLRFGLANEVASYLGSIDETIKSVYVYEPETATSVNGNIHSKPRLVPGINMIVQVSRKTAALGSLLASVVSTVEGEIRRLNCPDANALCSMIDIIVVDDQELASRVGYGALIGSLYTPPIEIWNRAEL
jgi:hypothetical protein